jgi:hypothetical protein
MTASQPCGTALALVEAADARRAELANPRCGAACGSIRQLLDARNMPASSAQTLCFELGLRSALLLADG